MSNLGNIVLATHLHLPGWWVRAFDAAAAFEGGVGSAAEQAMQGQLLPALTPLELHSLAMVLSDLQHQLCQPAAQGRLQIVVQEHLKHLSSTTRSRRFVFERCLQMLVGLRLLKPAESASGQSSYGLFQADQWHHSGDLHTSLELDLAPLGPELVLGWSDAQHDLVRCLLDETTGAGLLGELPPLAVSRSLWLELQGVEQLLYLRLERAVQWDAKWLQLDGVFGTSLTELFAETLEARRDQQQAKAKEPAAFASQLKCLARFGRKMVAHGALLPAVSDQYLALSGGAEQGLVVVWQLAAERLALLERSAEEQRAASALRRWHHASLLAPTAKLYLPPDASGEQRQRAEQLASALLAPECFAPRPLPMQPCQLLTPSGLYWELAQRSLPGSLWPLPTSLRTHRLVQLARAGLSGEVGEAFAAFSSLLQQSPELAADLLDLPFLTLSSPATRADEVFLVKAKALMKPGRAPSLTAQTSLTEPGPRLLPPTAKAETVQVTPVKPSVQAQQLASRMLKTAADELAKLRASDLRGYEDIKLAYLQTLDDASRRLLLDVQKRIQPAMFDEQLRQRLVRYMVDHPGAWRSAETSKAGNP